MIYTKRAASGSDQQESNAEDQSQSRGDRTLRVWHDLAVEAGGQQHWPQHIFVDVTDLKDETEVNAVRSIAKAILNSDNCIAAAEESSSFFQSILEGILNAVSVGGTGPESYESAVRAMKDKWQAALAKNGVDKDVKVVLATVSEVHAAFMSENLSCRGTLIALLLADFQKKSVDLEKLTSGWQISLFDVPAKQVLVTFGYSLQEAASPFTCRRIGKDLLEWWRIDAAVSKVNREDQ